MSLDQHLDYLIRIHATAKEHKITREWYESRPPYVQQQIDAYPPYWLYRHTEMGLIVCIYTYEEKERACTTCSMLVLRKYNPFVLLERKVFDVPFEELEKVREIGAEEP